MKVSIRIPPRFNIYKILISRWFFDLTRAKKFRDFYAIIKVIDAFFVYFFSKYSLLLKLMRAHRATQNEILHLFIEKFTRKMVHGNSTYLFDNLSKLCIQVIEETRTFLGTECWL
ncbi:unnamed protein product [marine sediment metagenome]|uniref:Uncharacterized protein n=1 Tax=marine sediment metagenome TaxID=412755 RepID=X1T726_9ZZZZ